MQEAVITPVCSVASRVRERNAARKNTASEYRCSMQNNAVNVNRCSVQNSAVSGNICSVQIIKRNKTASGNRYSAQSNYTDATAPARKIIQLMQLIQHAKILLMRLIQRANNTDDVTAPVRKITQLMRLLQSAKQYLY